MTIMKRKLTDTPASQLFYDTAHRELYVELKTMNGVKRLDIENLLKMDGEAGDKLHLLLIDLFKSE
jgi:hypothetical protein